MTQKRTIFLLGLFAVVVLMLGAVCGLGGCSGGGGDGGGGNVEPQTPPRASEPPGLPPDPGEAGKTTLKGIDSDNDGVRDDVQRYIELTVTDSARHREALKNVAKNIQRELLAQTKEESIQLAIEGVRTIECLSYLDVPTRINGKRLRR